MLVNGVEFTSEEVERGGRLVRLGKNLRAIELTEMAIRRQKRYVKNSKPKYRRHHKRH